MIIKGCIENNRLSQKDLFRHFYGYAAAICNRYVLNQNDLVEVVNDGFLKVFKELDKLEVGNDHQEQKIRAWIKSIMVHTSIDYYRTKNSLKNSPTYNYAEVDDVELKSETPLDKISYNELILLTNELPPMYKLVFNLGIIDGMTHPEIAKALNISEGTSKSNLSKARQIVIKLIEKKYKDSKYVK